MFDFATISGGSAKKKNYFRLAFQNVNYSFDVVQRWRKRFLGRYFFIYS